KQLTFYDGASDAAWRKVHRFKETYRLGTYLYIIAERHESDYYKELLVTCTDTVGRLRYQRIVPRKVFFFKNRTRFRNLALPMLCDVKGQPGLVLLESPANYEKNSNEFSYHDLKKETNLWNANLVLYVLGSNGQLEKKLLYHNSDYDLVPLIYQS